MFPRDALFYCFLILFAVTIYSSNTLPSTSITTIDETEEVVNSPQIHLQAVNAPFPHPAIFCTFPEEGETDYVRIIGCLFYSSLCIISSISFVYCWWLQRKVSFIIYNYSFSNF